ncbi:MAG: hypothetical protein ACI4Q4_01745, partial [Oscillospiraceae bacterium]
NACIFQKLGISFVYVGRGQLFGFIAIAVHGDTRRLVLVDIFPCLANGEFALVIYLGVDVVQQLLLFQAEIIFVENAVFTMRLCKSVQQDIHNLTADILAVNGVLVGDRA